ncbi:MAG: hypothetical protein HZA84_00400 [Thaumarchaeota archaeon]|nr:hypothetical protein [Nitrososphaerota archaeon]
MLLTLSEKGKYASGTENRRLVWKEIVWPLILELNNVAFTLSEYQKKRDEICAKFGISLIVTSRGLVSLLQKNLLFKEKDLYSIHYRLIPYMRLKAECDYATAIKEVRTK